MEEKAIEKLHSSLKSVLENYATVYSDVVEKKDFKNPFKNVITKEIPELIENCAEITSPYIIVGSYGKGRWTAVPWVAVFDTRITSSAQKGVYIVFLFNKDKKELYLTLEVAATEVIHSSNKLGEPKQFVGIANIKTQDEDKIKLRAAQIRKALNDHFFDFDNNINSGSNAYDAGAIYYKKYSLKRFPSGEEIIRDFQRMMDLYKKYYDWVVSKNKDESNGAWWPPISEYSTGINKEKWMEILNSIDIIHWGDLLTMFYTEPDGISCLNLGVKYDADPYSIKYGCIHLAMRVFEETKCPMIDISGVNQYWAILFQKIESNTDDLLSNKWKLRKELYEALTEMAVLKYLPNKKKETKPIKTKEVVDKIKKFISAKGFSYKNEMIDNYYLSLKTKPFVILAGISGTGKTQLAKLFAEAIGADFKLVPVRSDWSDSSDLFGDYDLNGDFIKGPVCDSFEKALDNPDRPVFLCLDEMNLARVENYMSDLLSAIEFREKLFQGEITTMELAQYKQGIPDNLYIVGTVNMDETTFPFSKKVLDRANTIEFNHVDLIPSLGTFEPELFKQHLTNSFLRSEYLLLNRDCTEDQKYVYEICVDLQMINDILAKANAHFGYRVRDEIVFYMLNNKKAGYLLDHNVAFDNEIMQKILPRIQGSSGAIREMLCDLFQVCASDHSKKNGDRNSDKMENVLKEENCRYPHSAEKLLLMVRRIEEEGYTSYWV